MSRTLPIFLIVIAIADSASRSFAAEQTSPAACDAAGVCTSSTNQPVAAGGKQIWANSRLYTDAPLPEMRKWLTDKPEMEGKFLVVEFWRTWCGACKRMTPLMSTLQKKYGAELVVIGITGQAEETIKAYAGPKKEYSLALDLPRPVEATAEEAGPASGRAGEQGQYEASFGVWGWPHVVILEPQYRTVVWEGFPGLKGFELTEAKVEKILAIGRAMKEEAKAKKK
jgi:thiol-disulfide isomerase/thioredoxin